MPLPAGATGDVYLGALDHVIAPRLAAFAPDWLLISAGFDAHRDDPITGLGLSAGDYAALFARLLEVAPAGRTITFLEGGYSLSGLRDSVAASIPVLAGGTGEIAPDEGPTSGGPGENMVRRGHRSLAGTGLSARARVPLPGRGPARSRYRPPSDAPIWASKEPGGPVRRWRTAVARSR